MGENSMQVSKEQFDRKKKELKIFGEGTKTNYEIEKFETSGGFFGLGSHKVTGSEMNDFISVVQKYFIKLGETDNKIIKEFQKVYDTFDVLDKEYINGIVGNMKTLEEECIKISNKFENNKLSMEELLNELLKTKKRLNETNLKTEEQSRIIQEQEKKGIERDKAIALGKKKDAEHDRQIKAQAEKDLEHDKAIEAGKKRDVEHDKLLKEQAEKDLEHDKAIEAGEKKDAEQDKLLKEQEKKDLEHDKAIAASNKKDAEQDKLLKTQIEKDLKHDEAIAEMTKLIADHENRLAEEAKTIGRLLLEIDALRADNKSLKNTIGMIQRNVDKEKWRKIK